MRAQDAALKQMTDCTMSRLLARNRSFDCADVKVGDSALFLKGVIRRRAPRRRGPAVILYFDDTGVTVRVHGANLQSGKILRATTSGPKRCG